MYRNGYEYPTLNDLPIRDMRVTVYLTRATFRCASGKGADTAKDPVKKASVLRVCEGIGF